MAKLHFVEKARKDNEVAKKGESYYWWSFRFGGKHYSKNPPPASQLESSPYRQELLSIQEAIDSITDLDELDDLIYRIENLADECQEHLDNMPEQLQESETGNRLQERADALERWRDELEAIDRDNSGEDNEKVEELRELLINEIKSVSFDDPE